MVTYVYVLDGWDNDAAESICKVYADRDDALKARDRVAKKRMVSAAQGNLYLGVMRKRVR